VQKEIIRGLQDADKSRRYHYAAHVKRDAFLHVIPLMTALRIEKPDRFIQFARQILPEPPLPPALSPRETRMVEQYQGGLSQKEIAALTGLSFKTVYGHLHNACGKLGLENPRQLLQLAAQARRNGNGHAR
jgi:DNA-binding CsgD family transcriptional regulator